MKKRILSVIAALVLALGCAAFFTACEDGESAAAVLTGITLKSSPAKTEYIVGEAFSPDGAKITAAYSDETEKTIDVTAAMCSAVDTKSAGSKSVIVTYAEGEISKSATFSVTVKQAAFKTATVENVNNQNKMISITFSMTEDVTFDAWNIDSGLSAADAWAKLVDTYDKALTGTDAQKEASAKIIGSDVFLGFYYLDGGERVWLSKSKGGNPLIKHKGWAGWLNESETGHWIPNGAEETYVGATMPKDKTFYTSVSEQSAYAGWLDSAVASGKVYVDFVVVQNGILSVRTVSADLPNA